MLATPQEEDNNPFKKRSKQEEKCFIQETPQPSTITPWDIQSKSTILHPNKKTVALQCNIIKGLPKLSLFSKPKEQKKTQTSKQTMEAPHPHVSTRARPLSKSVIMETPV